MTTSTIAILTTEGCINSVYVHGGGQLQYNGSIIFQHYQEINKIKDLINLGSLSSLGSYVSVPQTDNINYNVTLAYLRDRGRVDTLSGKYQSLDDYLEKGNLQNYNYLFNEKDKVWYFLKEKNIKDMQFLNTVLVNDPDVSQEIKSTILYEKLDKQLAFNGSSKKKLKI
jgi:hypothetical protein